MRVEEPIWGDTWHVPQPSKPMNLKKLINWMVSVTKRYTTKLRVVNTIISPNLHKLNIQVNRLQTGFKQVNQRFSKWMNAHQFSVSALKTQYCMVPYSTIQPIRIGSGDSSWLWISNADNYGDTTLWIDSVLLFNRSKSSLSNSSLQRRLCF